MLTTIFGLLFHDIIFDDIPGAFCTNNQHAPLDICDESFAASRKGVIDIRMDAIESGKAVGLLDSARDQNLALDPFAIVGVRRDMYSHDELSRLVKVSCLMSYWRILNVTLGYSMRRIENNLSVFPRRLPGSISGRA